MSKFKVGERVRVKEGQSSNSQELKGRVGTIIEYHAPDDRMKSWYRLDIEEECRYNSGIWEDELELEGPRIIKQYGIAKFCKENYV